MASEDFSELRGCTRLVVGRGPVLRWAERSIHQRNRSGLIEQEGWRKSVSGVEMASGRQGSKTDCVESLCGFGPLWTRLRLGLRSSHLVTFLTLPLVNTSLGCQAVEHSE